MSVWPVAAPQRATAASKFRDSVADSWVMPEPVPDAQLWPA